MLAKYHSPPRVFVHDFAISSIVESSLVTSLSNHDGRIMPSNHVQQFGSTHNTETSCIYFRNCSSCITATIFNNNNNNNNNSYFNYLLIGKNKLQFLQLQFFYTVCILFRSSNDFHIFTLLSSSFMGILRIHRPLPVGLFSSSGKSAAPVSQRSWVRIPYKPEFFSGFIFTTNCYDLLCVCVVDQKTLFLPQC